MNIAGIDLLSSSLSSSSCCSLWRSLFPARFPEDPTASSPSLSLSFPMAVVASPLSPLSPLSLRSPRATPPPSSSSMSTMAMASAAAASPSPSSSSSPLDPETGLCRKKRRNFPSVSSPLSPANARARRRCTFSEALGNNKENRFRAEAVPNPNYQNPNQWSNQKANHNLNHSSNSDQNPNWDLNQSLSWNPNYLSPNWIPNQSHNQSPNQSPNWNPSWNPNQSLNRIFNQALNPNPSENPGEEEKSPPPMPSSGMRRKRPPRLDLSQSPELVKTPGGFIPIEEAMKKKEGEEERKDNIDTEEGNYGVVCRKGPRKETMEDMYAAVLDRHGDSKQDFFGIFDGHGGRKAVEFVSQNIARNIAEALSSTSPQNMGEEEEEAIKRGIRLGYLTTDEQFLQQHVGSGASCVSAVVRNGLLIVANAGDCRAVLSRAGEAEVLSSDHRAGREDERQRIEKLGGYVDLFNGIWRVQGMLAITRGFGDMRLKQWISAEPEIKIVQIDRDCEFLILASDGVWDKVSNEEAIEHARNFLKKDHNKAAACKELAEMAISRGSRDDISVMIIDLQSYTKK